MTARQLGLIEYLTLCQNDIRKIYYIFPQIIFQQEPGKLYINILDNNRNS